MKRILLTLLAVLTLAGSLYAGTLANKPLGQGSGLPISDTATGQSVQEVYPRACKCTTPTIFSAISSTATVISKPAGMSSTYRGGWFTFINVTGTMDANVFPMPNPTPWTGTAAQGIPVAHATTWPSNWGYFRYAQGAAVDVIGNSNTTFGQHQECWDEN